MKILMIAMALALAGCMSNEEFRAADKVRGDALCEGSSVRNLGTVNNVMLPNVSYLCEDGSVR